ncbi:MAG: phosphatase PAP2 family protein [Rhodanobacter sp.]
MTASAPRPERTGWAFDPPLCRAASRWAAHRAVHRIFAAVSRLGDGWLWYGLMAVMATCAGRRGVHAALQMICTGIAAWLLYRTLKRRTRRLRPFRVHADVVARAPPLDEYSFPSGHTLHAVSFGIVATSWFPLLVLPLALFAVLVAMSRVILGLHYPTDVLAGAVLGTLLGMGSLWIDPLLTAALTAA